LFIILKILFDHQCFSRQAVGGVSRSFFELAVAINALPNEHAEIFAPLHWNEYLAERRRSSFVFGYRQTRGIFRFWNARWWLNYASTIAKCNLNPPDILHETWYSDFRYHLRAKTKIATTVHDLIYQVHPEWISDPATRSQQLRASACRSDLIFCVSEFTKNDLLNWMPTLDPSRVAVVHHGVSFLGTTDADNGLPEDKRHMPPSPYILYVGQRASKNKNFRTLVRAFVTSGLQTDFSLFCFGGGPFTVDEALFFKSVGLRDDRILQFSGNDDALRIAYESAAAFVYPSTYEGFGLPLLEAMLHGCAVVSSSATCLPEIGGDACLYFDPFNEDSIKEALCKILSDSDLNSALKAKGRQRVTEFSWQKTASKTVFAYKTVLM